MQEPMPFTIELPENFNEYTRLQQEQFLSNKFKELGKIETYLRRLLAQVRGGTKIVIDEKK